MRDVRGFACFEIYLALFFKSLTFDSGSKHLLLKRDSSSFHPVDCDLLRIPWCGKIETIKGTVLVKQHSI